MIWGETGTREGATPYQIATVGWLFSRYGIDVLHDGDAIGADTQLYHLGRAFGARIVIHPPTNDKYRAFCGQAEGVGLIDANTVIMPMKGYHARDEDIVNESEALVSIQLKPYELDHGGTRHTTDYARSINRPIVLVWPNGHTTYENWTLRKTYDRA